MTASLIKYTKFALLPLLATPFTTASAQYQANNTPPAISVAAQQEVKVTPDRAKINIAVETRAATAAQSAADNSKTQTAVLTALKALGLTDKQLSTTNYSVNPQYNYPRDGSPELIGYIVNNTIVVEMTDISTVGKAIDAALGAGANQISSLDFYASNTDSARQVAIGGAIAKARAEAAIAAQAAGGTLGSLLNLSISNDGGYRPPMPYRQTMAASADAKLETQINPGDQTVAVVVQTSWTFIPAQ